MLASGNLPTWSDETTLVIFTSFFCLFSDFTTPLWNPETITSSNSFTSCCKTTTRIASDEVSESV